MFSEVEAIAMMHETQLLPQLKQKITVRSLNTPRLLFSLGLLPLKSLRLGRPVLALAL